MLSVLAAYLLLARRHGGPVGWKHQKDFQCDLIAQPVSIRLRRRPMSVELFVQCSESDCQYVNVNKPPCPLTLKLFPEERKDP